MNKELKIFSLAADYIEFIEDFNPYEWNPDGKSDEECVNIAMEKIKKDPGSIPRFLREIIKEENGTQEQLEKAKEMLWNFSGL